MKISKILDSLNIKKQCRAFGVGLWQCPRFLFLIMGGIIIFSILIIYITYTITMFQKYAEEPQLIALIVLLVTAMLFIIGNIVVSSFERVAAASKAKSEFVSIMSHQLRTPLSEIKWQLNLLSDKAVQPGDSENRAFFSNLEEANQKMIHMINDLLNLHRVEDNALYLAPDNFSLKKIIEAITDRRKKYLKNSNVYFVIQDLDNLPDVFADKARIENVASNLLDNAIRYSDQNDSDGKITIILEKLPRFIKCSVKDKGIGISKEDAKMIFSKFFRAESAVKYQAGGLGIRLFLAKAFVEASGGKIGFESEEGKGSTFWFTLPIAKK